MRSHGGKCQLSFPSSGASVKDFVEVVDDRYELDHDNLKEGAKVIGIYELRWITFEYKEQLNDPLRNPILAAASNVYNTVRCLKNEHASYLLRQERSTFLFVYTEKEEGHCETQSDNISYEDLLSALSFDMKYEDYHNVTSISCSH